MNKYLEQFKNGNYNFNQIVEMAKALGFKAIGFEKGYCYSDENPRVYYIESYGLRPDMGVVKRNTWNDSTYKSWEDPNNVQNCFCIPATRDRRDNNKIYSKNKYGFVDDDGTVYEVTLEATYNDPANRGYYNFNYGPSTLENIKIKTRKLSNMQLFDDKKFLTTQEELADILENKNVWLKKFADEHKGIKLQYLFMAPYLETLVKANYEFAKNFLHRIGEPVPVNGNRYYASYVDQGILDKINRLCQPGKSPKEIFKAPKELYEALKTESNLDTWDNLRVMCKMDNLSPECALLVLDQNYSDRDLRMIRGILNKEYNGKKVFTFETLANYLHRLDMHEAIDRWEALEILEDYLRMCNQLEMEPKIDGDSLKREHDIAARLCRQHRDEIFSKKIAARCKELNKYNYENNTYLIRAIKDQPDLIDEATQQHNCVAGYASSIADGRSNIFVCRRKENPNKSLVTVELSPSCREIRQKYLAYNKPIYDKELTEFLDEWLERCKKMKEDN